VYKTLVMFASTFLVAFGGCFYGLGVEIVAVKSATEVALLPLACLVLGTVVLLHSIIPSPSDSLLSVTIGFRTWTPSRGFRPDPGLQLQPFLIPAFLIALWAAMQGILLSVGLVFSGVSPLSQAPAFLLLLSLFLADRELWAICRRSYERSLFASHDGAA